MDNFFSEINDFIEDSGRDIKFKFGDKIVNISEDHTPVFSYDYLNLNPECEFNFCSDKITIEDYKQYFNRVNELSQIYIGELIDSSDHTDHFHILNSPNRVLKGLLKETFNCEKFDQTNMPTLGQFSLYSKGKNKPHRIFFLIGQLGFLYLLYFDAEHKIFSATSNN
ncbi:hypothetical protein DMA11_10290 [Marinilabiliaceae bacterium JC017]|nr:hypothetical protein DMA11_10290 [Marinilabiliaceae bacterium JC017]